MKFRWFCKPLKDMQTIFVPTKYESLPLKDFIYNPFLPLKIIWFDTPTSSRHTVTSSSTPTENCKGCIKEFTKLELKTSVYANHASLCAVCKNIELRARDKQAVIESLKKME